MKLIIICHIIFIGLFQTQSKSAFTQEADSIEEATETKSLKSSDENAAAIDKHLATIKSCQGKETDYKCRPKLIASYNGLAIIYSNQDLYVEALNYAEKALTLAKETENQVLIAQTYYANGLINMQYYEFEVDPETNVVRDKKLANKPEIARSQFFYAYSIYKEIDDPFEQGRCLSLLANTYIQQEKYYDAKIWLNKALVKYEELHSTRKIVITENALAFVHIQLQDYHKALEYLEPMIPALDTISATQAHGIAINLSSSYENINEPAKALVYQKKAYNFSKESEFEQKRNELLEIKERYDNEKLMNQNLELERAAMLEKVKRNRAQVMGLIAGIAFLLLLVLTGILTSRNRYKQKTLELRLIQNQKELEVQSINALVDGKEAERSDIARYLHDQVASLLNSANIHLEVLSNKQNIKDPLLDKTQLILDDVSDKIRTLSHDLLNDALSKFGLTIALDDLCRQLTTPKLEFKFISNIREGKRYDAKLENKVYGIAQELCNNVIKHSGANIANIHLNEKNDVFELAVVDNGYGFKNKDVEQFEGMGLRQIKIRVQTIGGQFTIEEDPDFTTVSVKIPIEAAIQQQSKIDSQFSI